MHDFLSFLADTVSTPIPTSKKELLALLVFVVLAVLIGLGIALAQGTLIG